MITYTKRQIQILLGIIVALLLLVIGIRRVEYRTIPPQNIGISSGGNIATALKREVTFSLPCGFYTEDQFLTLQADGAHQILYTMDGTDPRENGLSYTGPIVLANQKPSAAYTVRACACYSEGGVSDVVTRTYFVSEHVYSRYKEVMVFSITIDPEDLYGYEDGLFIEGKMRDDYLAEHPELNAEELSPEAPANWNQRGAESEREAYVDVFEPDGTCVISQPCGFRIFGGVSRGNDQKNIRLFARSEYDVEDNRFRYAFFPDAKDTSGRILDSYKRISLRASGNDFGFLYMREDMISDAIHALDIEAKYSRPVAVFINGEYYGFAWCQQVFGDDLLDHKYNLEESVWDIVSIAFPGLIEEDEGKYWEKAAEDWKQVMSFSKKDLTDDKVFNEISQQIDVDDFLTYFAANAYIGNEDWPINNMKVFRYNVDANTPLNYDFLSPETLEVCDGRWRCFSFDTDISIGLYGRDANHENIKDLFQIKDSGIDSQTEVDPSELLSALCQRDDAKERFITLMCDMMNWHFGSEHGIDHAWSYHNLRLSELSFASQEQRASIDEIEYWMSLMEVWMQERPQCAIEQLQAVFPGYESLINLCISPSVGASIDISTISLSADDGEFSGTYFAGIDIPVSCTMYPGYLFDHWEINGIPVYQQSFMLNSKDYDGSQIQITLHVEQSRFDVRISEVGYKGNAGDYFVITNYGSEVVSTFGMYLCDGSSDDKFILPKMHIMPGESRKFVCPNYLHTDAIGLLQAPYNLKEEEILTLYQADGSIIHQIFLLEATDGTTLKYNVTASRYEEYVRP